MKGAYVCSDRGVPAFGHKGCSLHVQEVMRAMKNRGIQLSLFAASTGECCPNDLKNIDVYKVKHAKIQDRQLREQSDIRDNRNAIEVLSRHAPFEFIYERYSLWSHAGMSFGHKQNIPTILEVNAPLVEEQKKYRALHDEQSAYNISKLCFKQATTILAVSEQVAGYLDSFKEAKGKIHVLPNGVNTDKFRHCCHNTPHNQLSATIGFVGTLKPWHGVELLIEAFALVLKLHPHCRLLIVGDGPELSALKQQAKRLNIEQSITFTGSVSPERIDEYYNQMDIAVAPYPKQHHFYFSPLKIYEYMAAGLPTISSNLGQINRIIRHGETGLIYDAEHPESLVFALSFLIHKPELALQLGNKAREEAELKHSWDFRVQSILSLAGLAQVA
ncbi:glycosyltransferase family 4 protein [Vibrio sinaloensis]|uniref:glycosyltransferase family 4 protein n=1 Tax=Photobacterium sp. (strain ATCC 43367) TaxID=379097 RepID=UPI0035E7E743